jgi:16S rRNA (guanine527-N7)-methyltransferase
MTIPVSRETQERLDLYLALLIKWQAKINLVAPDTIKDAWARHFEDSLQVLKFIECHPGQAAQRRDPGSRHNEIPAFAGMTLVDMGTGAGFPGLVVAIARPDVQVHLVESDAKKCEFLKTVSRETGLSVATPTQVGVQNVIDPGFRRNGGVCIYNQRIEAVAPFTVDVITARALAPLAQLLSWAKPYVDVNPGLRMVFLKGETWQDEVRVSRETFKFDLEGHPSLTSPRGRVLIITGLQKNEA